MISSPSSPITLSVCPSPIWSSITFIGSPALLPTSVVTIVPRIPTVASGVLTVKPSRFCSTTLPVITRDTPLIADTAKLASFVSNTKSSIRIDEFAPIVSDVSSLNNISALPSPSVVITSVTNTGVLCRTSVFVPSRDVQTPPETSTTVPTLSSA